MWGTVFLFLGGLVFGGEEFSVDFDDDAVADEDVAGLVVFVPGHFEVLAGDDGED